MTSRAEAAPIGKKHILDQQRSYPLVHTCRSEGLRISPIGTEWTVRADAKGQVARLAVL
jgi:hypothetical protein